MDLEQSSEKTTKLAIAYEVDYAIEDEALSEPFIVYKPVGRRGYAWWNNIEGKNKVIKLFEAFKMDYTVHEAVIYVGITQTQYNYFCSVHPTFAYIKSRLQATLAMVAKHGVVNDVGLGEFAARKWYLEKRQPEIYNVPLTSIPPPIGAAGKISAEAWLDENGKIIVSKQSAELITNQNSNGEEGNNN